MKDLEEALLTDGTEETSWLQELIVRLLSGCLANNDISTFNYQMFLRRLFRQKCQEHDRFNPFNTDIDFQFLPLRTKVEILQALCDFRLDAEDVLDHLKNLEADSLRVEPLGYDDNESAYWYFYGTRLYREDFTFKNNKKVKTVWQVICFTEDDWYQLARKFRKSSSKVERQLYRTLSENFLPELPRLFQEKEVLHRKRLLEWLPRRTSTRLDLKRQQIKESEVSEGQCQVVSQEEIDKKDEELVDEEEEDTTKSRKKNKKRKEQSEAASASDPDTSTSDNKKRKLDVKRDAVEMAERRKQRELRSLNRDKKDKSSTGKDKSASAMPGVTPVGRQTNNSLASATGQIVIQSVSNPNRKKLKTSQVFRQSAEDLQTGMYKILEAIKNHEDAWPFVEPVEEEYAPNYYTVIRRPMDLQRMEDKLDAGVYVSFSKFRQDFQLIVDNCRLYNGTDNEYTEMVDNLQQIFQRATDRYLDQISSSDEEIAVEFQETSKDSRTTTSTSGGSTQSKRKKTEPTVVSRRKPTSLAHTADKRDRSTSVETDGVEIKNQKPIKTKPQAANKLKNAKNIKQTKRNKKAQSTSPVQSPSRSPSWPPSSPEHWKSSEKHDTSPSVTSQQKMYDSSDDDKVTKTKGKHKHWKEVFKDKDSVKHKDKNIKLKETIEKLKAKSELSLSDDGVLRAKNKDDKQQKAKPTEKEKNIKKQPPNKKVKSKEVAKPNKTSKCEYDFDDEEGDTKDSNLSDKKKKVKKAAVKNVADIEALAAATEQTLKDINKWLDDTPRFSEFSSASNSPSHFIGTEDSDPIGSKIEQDFRKTLKVDKPMPKPKDGQKDLFKRRPANKDPTKLHRRREIQRTIERLQPGKSKGNLLSNIQNANKPEEIFPLGPLSKLREAKNSLVVKADDTAPKLSLGSVLDSFGQQHNFKEDNEDIKDDSNNTTVKSEVTESNKEEECKKEEVVDTGTVAEKKEVKSENKATPNLSAWFKAFGAPKVQLTQKRKVETDEEKKEVEVSQEQKPAPVVEQKPVTEEPRKVVSPEPESPAGPGPGPGIRPRRGSTGSSVSERSSFSQDLDSSPRMSIDERLGAYPAPYPSPLHRSPASASPVMASPRQEDTQRPYPTLNGSIRVGFYQDTVSTKSSPDKSCSPRDQPHSPYQQYSEHVYTPPTTIQGGGFYSNTSYYAQNPTTTYTNPTYYDTTKPLTDQYNAKVPAPNTFQSEESVNSPEPEYKNPITPMSTETQPFRQQIRVPEKQSTMFPVKKRLYSENELANRPENREEQEPLAEPQERNLEMGLMTGRQLNITPNQQMSPVVQEHQDVNMQQLNMPAPMRPMNYPATTSNVYSLQNHENTYTLSSRNIDILNQTSNVDMSRNTQYYPDSRVMSMGYIPRTEAPMQNTEMLQMSQATRSSTMPNNYMDQTLGLRGNLANLSHIVDRYPTDERLPYYSDKTLSSPHMFPKVGPTSNTVTMFNQPPNISMPYSREMQQAPANLPYTRTLTELQSPAVKNPPQQSPQQQPPPPQPQVDKKSTRKRKTKQQPQLPAVSTSEPNQQGFQSYAGLKNVSGEPSAISLKTASVVPGSAFNFGPTPSGLGLSAGLYEKESYPGFLEEYRATPNYYIAHRATPEGQPRAPGYSSLAPPFMGAHGPQPLMDPGSPLYQQYLHQALLAPPAGYPPGYHPALSMRQPYDSMTRPSWL